MEKVYIEKGSFYEDCAYHPCLCISVNEENDEILGISLIDGSFPRSCSLMHCGIRELTFGEAVHSKFHGPKNVENFNAPWVDPSIGDPRT